MPKRKMLAVEMDHELIRRIKKAAVDEDKPLNRFVAEIMRKEIDSRN